MDLLDARGYEIRIEADNDCEYIIDYLGALDPDHIGEGYDDDLYVKSRIEDQKARGTYETALKDSGIRKTGLHVKIRSEGDIGLKITVAKDKIFALSPKDGIIDEVLDVSDVCLEEKEYLGRIKSVLYSSLKEADRICTKYDIPYYLVFGGLLGALRYGEIIPWDDDADIAMTREDYIRFKKACEKELSPGYELVDCRQIGDDVFLDFMCRIVCRKEKIPCNIFRKAGDKCREDLKDAIATDIFILDNASDIKWRHKLQMLLVRTVYGLSMGHRAYININEYDMRDRKTRFAVRILPKIGKLFSSKTLFDLHDRICTRYNGKDTKDYFMSNGFLPFIHTRYEKAWFGKGSRIGFGPLTVNAPSDMKAYLKRAYYDYYHLVPMHKRRSMHSESSDGVFI